MSMHPQAIPLPLPNRFIARTRSWREGMRKQRAPSDRFAGEPPCHFAFAPPTIGAVGPLTQSGMHVTFACMRRGVSVLHLTGRWRGLVSFMESNDGIIWHPVALDTLTTGRAETETTKPGMWRTPPGFTECFLRVQVCTLTHGTITGVFAAAAWPEARTHPLPHAA